MFYYMAAGLRLASAEEISGLKVAGDSDGSSVEVRFGNFNFNFSSPPLVEKPFVRFNETELYFEIPEIIKMGVRNGNVVEIQPLAMGKSQALNHFYSAGLTALWLQNNTIPFHVSGVLNDKKQVFLLCGPSRSGKSTTLVKLIERGFHFFTDDTATIEERGGIPLARASYPIMRLWNKTLENQRLIGREAHDFMIGDKGKFGFYTHDQFDDAPREIGGVFFINAQLEGLQLKSLSPPERVILWGKNVFRDNWIAGMNKGRLKFELTTALGIQVPAWEACRPRDEDTFDSFADMIAEKIHSLGR